MSGQFGFQATDPMPPSQVWAEVWWFREGPIRLSRRGMWRFRWLLLRTKIGRLLP